MGRPCVSYDTRTSAIGINGKVEWGGAGEAERKAYFGHKIIIFGVDVKGTDACHIAMNDVLLEVDGQDAMIGNGAIVKVVRMKMKREELPLVIGNLVEKVVVEVCVGPFAWSAAPRQPVVGDIVADEQVGKAADGFAVGVDEGGKDAQTRPSDDADVDAGTIWKGAEDAQDLGWRPVFLEGAERYVGFGILGDIVTDVFCSGHGDKLGELGERARVGARH